MANIDDPFAMEKDELALIVVDMQNDFVRRDAPFSLPACHEIIPRVKSIVDRCRTSGIPVIYLKFTSGPQETLIWTWSKPLRPETKACWKGVRRYYEEIKREAEGHDIIDEIYPSEGDSIVEKYSYGGFYQTNLASLLKAIGKTQLVIVGCAAPFCIDDTVTGAFDRQFKVIVTTDATGYFDREFLDNSLRRIGMKYGLVLTTDDLLTRI